MNSDWLFLLASEWSIPPGSNSSLMPYGLSTNYRGLNENVEGTLTLYASDGITYIKPEEITKGEESVDSYKVMISKTCAEHAGEPGSDGKFRVIPSSMRVLQPKEVCTHSYFIVGDWKERETAENAFIYMKTKFVRFLMLMCVSGYGLSKLVLPFVPLQDFSKQWNDEDLYEKYRLTEKEKNLIEDMIKPF